MRSYTGIPTLFDAIREWECCDRINYPILCPSLMAAERGVQIYEDAAHLYVEVELPGIRSDAITVTRDKRMLRIAGEVKEESKEMKYHLKSSRNFSYAVRLPSGIDASQQPTATHRDGVLKITFAKVVAAAPQRIEVQTS